MCIFSFPAPFCGAIDNKRTITEIHQHSTALILCSAWSLEECCHSVKSDTLWHLENKTLSTFQRCVIKLHFRKQNKTWLKLVKITNQCSMGRAFIASGNWRKCWDSLKSLYSSQVGGTHLWQYWEVEPRGLQVQGQLEYIHTCIYTYIDPVSKSTRQNVFFTQYIPLTFFSTIWGNFETV